MSTKDKELFTKRLASLLLAQARSKPYIQSGMSSSKTAVEILVSKDYWDKKEKQWKGVSK